MQYGAAYQPFHHKIIQSHWFWHQSKVCIQLISDQ